MFVTEPAKWAKWAQTIYTSSLKFNTLGSVQNNYALSVVKW